MRRYTGKLRVPGFETIGCYNDTSNRAIQPLEGKDSILDGSYSSRKNPIAKCAVAAMRAGYSMFAVQYGGWCAASATAVKTFDKYGTSAACEGNGEGGPLANQVYVIKGKSVLGYKSCVILERHHCVSKNIDNLNCLQSIYHFCNRLTVAIEFRFSFLLTLGRRVDYK